jgi:O-antigen/teichoic acid export membrane protein
VVDDREEEVSVPRSKIAENTIFLTVSGAASVVFTLVQLSVLSRSMSGNDFGLFVTLRGFSLLLGTIMLVGLPQVLVRFLPSYEARGEGRRALTTFFASTVVVLGLGGALLLVSSLWEEIIPRRVWALVPSQGVMFWLALSSITLALKLLLYGGFNGFREMKLQMVLELAFLAVFTAYIVVVRDRLAVASLFEAMFIINAVVFVAGIPLFVRHARRCAPGWGAPAAGVVAVPRLATYWLGSVALSIVALAFTDVDRFVMSSVLPMAAVSLFHVASRVDALLKRFLGLPIIAAQPEITRVYEEGRWHDIAGRIELFTKGILVAALLCVSLFAIVGEDIITVLSGTAYAGSYAILLILLLTVPLAAVAAPLVATMRSLHFIQWAVLCDFLWMAVYFGTFFLFVSALGVKGMAVAQVLASAVQMTTAVLLARHEGFFTGIGSRIGRVVMALGVITAVGVLVTRRTGWYASAIAIALAPFAAKVLISRLRVFEPDETGRILELVTVPAGRRAAAWFLSAERR